MRPTRDNAFRAKAAALLVLGALMGHDFTVKADGPEAAQQPTLEIVKASWGSVEQQADVTQLIQDALTAGKPEINVTYQALGDPAVGKAKQLELTYRVNGQSVTKQFKNKSKVKFADLIAGFMPPKAWTMLQLTSQEPRESTNGSTCGSLLVRELQRQAVLIAARDELGLSTRDMALGDPLLEENTARGTLLVGMQSWVGHEIQMILALPGGTGASDWKAYPSVDLTTYAEHAADKVLVHTRFQEASDPLLDYAALVTKMEAQSRQEDLDALHKAGLAPAANLPANWTGNAEPNTAAVKALQVMDPVAQFAALRILHNQLHVSGDTPALDEALVRGYANLSFMTQPLYSGAYKTYMARSLLYAERLVAHDPAAARPLYVRAYARAMAGLSKLALEDLAAASQKADGAAVPEWSPLMDSLCRYDLAGMEKAAAQPGEYKSLAQMLVVAIAADDFAKSRITDVGMRCLRDQPTNLWVMQQLYLSEQLGTFAEMPGLMIRALPAALTARGTDLQLPDQAENARKTLARADGAAQYQAVAAFCKSLDAAAEGDTAEPSLAAFSAMVRDEEFLSVYMEAKYLRDYLGTDTAQVAAYATESAPAWQNHPLAGLVERKTLDPSADSKGYLAALDKIKPVDAGTWYLEEVLNTLAGDAYLDRWNTWLQAEAHGDLLPRDQTASSLMQARLDRDRFIMGMREQSPYAALPLYAWMSNYPKEKVTAEVVASAVADIHAHFPGRVNLTQTAARWANLIHDRKLAAQLLVDLEQSDPSVENASALANVYESSGEVDKAIKLVNASMKLPSAGLQTAAMCQDLAYALMRSGRSTEALKYATEAGDTGSSWGLVCLAECDALLGQMDKTAELLQSNAERYPDQVLRWYAWTRRNKRPEMAAAKKALDAYAAQRPDDIIGPLYLDLLDGNFSKVLDLMKSKELQLRDPASQVMYAMVAAQAGNMDEVDATLKKLLSKDDPYESRDVAVAMQGIRKGTDVAAAVLKFELTLNSRLKTPRSDDCGTLGRFLAATGHKPEAIRLLSRSVRSAGTTELSYALVWKALEALGENPAALIKAAEARKVDLTPLPGAWKAQHGDLTEEWKFAADGTVESSNGSHGDWWEDAGRILISWSPAQWAVLPLPLNPTTLHGDSAEGPGKLVIQKK